MARITEVSSTPASRTRSRTKQTSSKPPPIISYLIFVLPAISIVIGGYAHYTSLIASPFDTFDKWSELPPQALRVKLGIPPRWGQRFDSLAPPLDRILYVLALGFRDLTSHDLGRGLFLVIVSLSMTPLAAMLFDALRPGTPRFLGVSSMVTISMLGQLLMLGFAVPVIYIPLWAGLTWRQATKTPQVITPLPSAPQKQIRATLTAMGLSFLTILWLLVAPPSGKQFFWASTSFQFAPLFWLPLAFFQPKDEGKTVKEPRLAAAKADRLLAYLSVPLYWYGSYLAAPSLLRMFRSGAAWPDQTTRLIWFDSVALCLAWYILVLIQAEVDVRALQCGGPRVHRARLFIEDLIFGTGGLLLLGPGFGMGMYFARRENLAEKARWGVQPDFAVQREVGVDRKVK